jgi:alkyl hydroperoxide reductase subunit AhpC
MVLANHNGTFVIEVHGNGIGRDAKELLRQVQAAQYVTFHPGEKTLAA